ncbi:MAG: TonB-dependent receptor family protein [Flavobacteriaceae bacterium]|nr:TonB-dependent receptor family protein [Flavobacteriaceae bacterium]
MKKILTTFILTISISLFAQSPKIGVITGKVVDASTQEELPYVSIVIKDAKDAILTGGITNEKGLFEIKQIPTGENTIEIQFIGYKTEVKKISFSRKSSKHDLGTVGLSVDASQLDEVVIIAETSTVVQKIDRKVINVGKDLTSAGTTASELLNNVQSVSVDSQTGNLSLRGNENVRVLIDGKPANISTAQLLQQIPSTSIKQIELITNPSAKYNPEGMSGIINIILHKNANQGFNGNINTGVTQGINTRFNGSINMNYKTGKVNFFTNYGYNAGKRNNFGNVANTGTFINNQAFIFNNESASHLLKFGADIYINDKNTISLYTTQNRSNRDAEGSSEISEGGVLLIDAPNDAITDTESGTYNFNYKRTFEKEGHEIEFEATYTDTYSSEYANFSDLIDPSNNVNNYFNDIPNDRSNTLINLDYTNPISEDIKLEIGFEIRNDKTENRNLSDQHNYTYDAFGNISGTTPIGDVGFDYDRDIYSGYINYAHKFEKISMQLGARIEQYQINGTFSRLIDNTTENIEDEIFSIYPSAFFTYTPSDKNQWQFSYSRRVDRPSIRQVNPIRQWSTPLVTSVGNPELRPQFTNSFEVNYTRDLKKGSITFGTFFRRVNDDISRQSSIDPLNEEALILSYLNFDNTNRYGIELSSNYKLAKWWRVNASMDYYSQVEQSLGREVRANAFNMRVSNSFKASKKLNFQLFAMYRGPREGIQFNRKSMSMINLGSSYKVLKGKGTINFRVNDIFKGMRFKFDSTDPFVREGQFNWESRTAYIGFAYRFGGGKNKALRRKNRDNNETQGGGGFM